MERFRDKVVVITGGTSGIGLAAARRFAGEGAAVIVTGASETGVVAARAELGPEVEVVRSDAGDGAAAASFYAGVAAARGGIDVLFINAGIVRNGGLGELDEATFDEVMRVNTKGPWLALTHAAPHLRPGASVVVTTSVANQLGIPGAGAYSASKAALRSLVRTAAAEWVGRGIRVNAISPGPTRTPIFHKQGLPAEAVPVVIDRLTSMVPQRRLAEPDEIAAAVAFLASPDASFVTGGELVAGGGLTML